MNADRYGITWRPDRSGAPRNPLAASMREVVMRAVTSGDERELLDAGEASGLLGDVADLDGRYVGALERQPFTERPMLVLRSAP